MSLDKKSHYDGLSPWEIIVKSAEEICMPIKQPKKNCKRCHGRGYRGMNSATGYPIPCQCILVKEDIDTSFYEKRTNRAERRKRK